MNRVSGPNSLQAAARRALPLLLCCGLGCAHFRGAAAGPAEPGLPAVIDVHTHTTFGAGLDGGTGKPDTLDEFLRQRREAGIAASVSFNQWAGAPSADLSAHHVLHCAGVGDKIDPQALARGLEDHRYGCIKIYLGYIRRYASDPAYDPVYRLAARHKVPVVFHTGDTVDKSGLLKYADPLTIDEVAVANRDVNFVIAHLGNPWIESAAEVAYKNPNVYVEASALLVGDLSRFPPEQVEEYMVKPIRWAFGYIEDPKKFMFGTDWPLNDMKAYLEAYKKAIPREHWKAVFRENALRVFNIPREWADGPR